MRDNFGVLSGRDNSGSYSSVRNEKRNESAIPPTIKKIIVGIIIGLAVYYLTRVKPY